MCQPQVAKDQVAFSIDEDICWLEVPMDDSYGVEGVEGDDLDGEEQVSKVGRWVHSDGLTISAM